MFSGYVAQFEPEEGVFRLKGVPTLESDTFELAQFHYHFGRNVREGSEHRLNGRKTSGEVRLN